MARYDDVLKRFSGIVSDGSSTPPPRNARRCNNIEEDGHGRPWRRSFRRRDFLSFASVATLGGAPSWRAFAQAPVTLTDSRRTRVQQRRNIEVSGATLECT